MTSNSSTNLRNSNKIPAGKNKHNGTSVYDPESDHTVTSTSGQKVNVSAAKAAKRRFLLKPRVLPKSVETFSTILNSKASPTSKHTQSRRHHQKTTVVKEKLPPAVLDDPLDPSNNACQRLLMREWLLEQMSVNNIPGLRWLDESQKLICIPWIHASKEGWSRDHHSKLFENWAIYTGRFNPGKTKPDPKRWKANFRCALNSLPDVKEVKDLNCMNGADGYKVYRFDEAVERKGHRKLKLINHSVTSEPWLNTTNEMKSQPLDLSITSTSASTSGNSQSNPKDNFSKKNPSEDPKLTGSAHNTEPVQDTVPPSNEVFTSISSANDAHIHDVMANVVVETTKEETRRDVASADTDDVDIISVRNMDHNYFKIQIPTTVENYVDDDNPPETGTNDKSPKKKRTVVKK